MIKKDLIERLNKIYFNIENSLNDDSIMAVGKYIEKQKDELGNIIQEIEDDGINE